jgi:hypothetical protein
MWIQSNVKRKPDSLHLRPLPLSELSICRRGAFRQLQWRNASHKRQATEGGICLHKRMEAQRLRINSANGWWIAMQLPKVACCLQ